MHVCGRGGSRRRLRPEQGAGGPRGLGPCRRAGGGLTPLRLATGGRLSLFAKNAAPCASEACLPSSPSQFFRPTPYPQATRESHPPPLCKQMRHLWFIRALWGFAALCIENKTRCVFSCGLCRAGGGAFPAAPLALGLRVGPGPLPRGVVTSTFSPVASDERLVLTRVLTGAAARRVTAPVGGERGSLARPQGAGTWAWGRGQTEQAGLQAPPTKSRARVLIRGWR